MITFFQRLFGKPKKSEKADLDPGHLKCPNCGNDKWYEGPGGGSFGNIECGNCHKAYNNMGPFGLSEISSFVKQ